MIISKNKQSKSKLYNYLLTSTDLAFLLGMLKFSLGILDISVLCLFKVGEDMFSLESPRSKDLLSLVGEFRVGSEDDPVVDDIEVSREGSIDL